MTTTPHTITITSSTPTPTVCVGRGSARGKHCCYVNGSPCEFLERDVEGRRFSCQLRRTLGSWDAVVDDPRYLDGPGAVWEQLGVGVDYCRTWQPASGGCCREER